jgi:hypothetical protein
MKYLALLLLGGCILPVSTGAPLPATTVGQGNVGFALSGEAPTLDLISDQDNKQAGSDNAVAYGAAPAAAATLTFSYGITDETDVEVSGEGALYFFIVPIPTGGSIGIRQHIDLGDSFDFGLAARFGHVGNTGKVTNSNGDEVSSGARANYGALQAIIQSKTGVMRPMLAVNFMPASIHRSPSDGDPFNFKGMASSVTLGLQFVGSKAMIEPYLTATNFYSDKFNNSGFFVSGGILFAARPDRNRPKIDLNTMPPPGSYDPSTPAPAPYGPPAPQTAPMTPPPPSAPAPTTAPM